MNPSETRLLVQFLKSYPEKSTSALENLSDQEVTAAVSDLAPSLLCQVLNRLKTHRASRLLVSLPPKTFSKIYSLLDPVRAAHLLLEAGSKEREEKVVLLSESEKKDLEELMSYPADSAGFLMDTSVRTCRESDTIREAITNLKKSKTIVREVFVTDIDGCLVGFFPVQDLLFSEDDMSVASIMHKSPPHVNALSPKSEVSEIFEKFKTTMLPVIHVDGRLLGAIRYSSLVQEIQNRALSTMASLGGASPSERALSPPLFSVGKRLPWLLINLVTAFIASAVVGYFEGTIAKVTALAVLLPVVAGQSGNTGAQAMAVTMRGLALREVRTRQWISVLFKELRVGFINGIFIAFVTGAAVYFWSKSLPLGAVMVAAMTFSMIIASISGAAIPVILTSLGRDPAQSSSVILTTVTDVIGFLSFLGLAALFVSVLTGV